MNKLKPCPCGKVPEGLHVVAQGIKYAYASGSCCNMWGVEFRSNYYGVRSEECVQLAKKAWNDAPRSKAKLPKSAYKLIQRYKNTGDTIFPFNSRSVSSYFTKSCKMLGIKDLHFHDLRHEAVSRLFVAGLNVPQVQKASLHQSWASLSVYTNLFDEDIDI